MDTLEWTKNLSTTDALQPTQGRLVPYLRLTKGSLTSEDFRSWFREDFFFGADWAPSSFGHETSIESCHVDMTVSINGVAFGAKNLQLTHGQNRRRSNNTANTWIHWPTDIQTFLKDNDTTGHAMTLTRKNDGSFELKIQAANA